MDKTINIISVDVLQSDIDVNNVWPMVVRTSRVIDDSDDIKDHLHVISYQTDDASDKVHRGYLHADTLMPIVSSNNEAIALAIDAIRNNHYIGDLITHYADDRRAPRLVSFAVAFAQELDPSLAMPRR